LKNKEVARKSLVASKNIKAGEKFNDQNLTVLRPGSGISPERFWSYLGRNAQKNYTKGDLINE